MLTFSKSSWHYRMASYDFVHNVNVVSGHEVYHSLCEYVTSVVFGFLFFSCSTVIISGLIILNVFGLIAWHLGIWNDPINAYPAAANILTGGCLLAFTIMFFVKIIIDISYALEYKEQYFLRFGVFPPSKAKKPSLLREWYKSVKEKYCPMVKFED